MGIQEPSNPKAMIGMNMKGPSDPKVMSEWVVHFFRTALTCRLSWRENPGLYYFNMS